jgi:hypothetical protein
MRVFMHRIVVGSAMSLGLLLGLAAAASAEESAGPTTRPYPLKTCVVSDKTLGVMGEPVVLMFEGREVRLCCSGCEKPFAKEPAKYLKKLDDAQASATTRPATQPSDGHAH